MENIIYLPNKDLIKEIITDYYDETYGTNYDEISLERSIKGAEVIVEWLFKNC